MGKRKNKGTDEYSIKKKIRKLERKLRRKHISSESSSEEFDEVQSPNTMIDGTDSDDTDQQVVNHAEEPSEPTAQLIMPSADLQAAPPIPADILEALGEAKGKPEVFGPKIQEEISKRWERILSEGLNKDQKQGILDKILIPENFLLAKAPKLNPEISAVLQESSRNRDKRLEKAQQYLGAGIAGLTTLISNLINSESLDKIGVIKKLSEINQVLLDLHFENTVNRRKLITPTLDKKFLNIVQDVKRDSYLFGEGLGDKIKACKTAEKSGFQIKRSDNREAPSKRHTVQQGNWRGPPRQPQRGGRQGGARYRSNYQHTRRPGLTPSRYQAPTKPEFKPSAKPQ